MCSPPRQGSRSASAAPASAAPAVSQPSGGLSSSDEIEDAQSAEWQVAGGQGGGAGTVAAASGELRSGWLRQYGLDPDPTSDRAEFDRRLAAGECFDCLSPRHFDAATLRPFLHGSCPFHKTGSTDPKRSIKAARYRPQRS